MMQLQSLCSEEHCETTTTATSAIKEYQAKRLTILILCVGCCGLWHTAAVYQLLGTDNNRQQLQSASSHIPIML